MMKQRGSLIVTGGSSGIGEAVLLELQNKVNSVSNIDQQIGIDVRDYDSVLEVMQKTIIANEENFLFSNAGVAFFTNNKGQVVDFASAPISQLHDMVDINLKGQINVLHAFIKTITEKNATGNIVVTSSISAFHSGGVNMAVYDATKAAISALAQRLVPYSNTRINIIEPGSIRTNIGGWNPDFSANTQGLNLVKQGQDSDQQSLGREVSLEQIVNVVCFLFFENHGMNGSKIVIDEGLTLSGRKDY